MVRYSTTAYPTTIASGTLLINTTAVNKTIIPNYLSNTYYFSYWTYVYNATIHCWSATYNTSILTVTRPTNMAVTSFTNNSISLSWNKGTGNTVVVRNATAYPTNHTKGTEVYNGTLEVFTDTGLLPSHKYYYRAWDWNGTAYSPGYTNVSQYTRPNKTYNLHYALVGSNSLNISWLNGTGSQRTVIRKSTTAQPVTPTDGTLLYNGTAHYKVDATITQPYYYTLFSYNITTGLYSADAPLTWYVVWVTVYDINTNASLSGWSLFITNQSGSDSYYKGSCTNPTLINVSDMPTGTGCTIQINKSWYRDAIFTRDIAITGNYYISSYLSGYNDSALYYLRVVETVDTGYGESDRAVESATVTIKKYNAFTSAYEVFSSLLTDANGYVNLYLESNGTLYKVIITKTGYDDATSDYIPMPPNEWGQTVEKVFRLVLTAANVTPPPAYVWGDYITFTGYLDNSTGLIHVNYTDALTNTTDWQLFIYEIDPNSTTPILLASWSGTNNSFNMTTLVPDVNSSYKAVFHVNHTNFGYQSLEIYFWGYYHPITSSTRFNLLFTLNYGYNPFGWANTFMFLLIIGIMFSFERKNTYMAVFAIGFILLFVNFYIGIQTVWSAIAAGVFPSILIFFGILMLIRDRGYSGVS